MPPLIPQIPPPPWTPAVLQDHPRAVGVAGTLQDGPDDVELVNSDDDDDNTMHRGQSSGSLSSELVAIDSTIDQVQPTRSGRQTPTVLDYVDAIGELCGDQKEESQSLGPPVKKTHGNFGFFKHVRDQRALTPRAGNESASSYESRLRETARESWNNSDT